jgi:hypothetical protein
MNSDTATAYDLWLSATKTHIEKAGPLRAVARALAPKLGVKWEGLEVTLHKTLAKKTKARQKLQEALSAWVAEGCPLPEVTDRRAGNQPPTPAYTFDSATAAKAGRIGGKTGGKARAEILSPERRREIASVAAKTRWNTQS